MCSGEGDGGDDLLESHGMVGLAGGVCDVVEVGHVTDVVEEHGRASIEAIDALSSDI